MVARESVNENKPSYLNYISQGPWINYFLRNGKFDCENFTPAKKIYNRRIIDSIECIDNATHSSHLSGEAIVFRDAPLEWRKTSDNGILIDRGYCSTSLVPGSCFGGNIMRAMQYDETPFRYKIYLPEGTPYLDLSDTSERELVLPRNSRFLDLGDGSLKYLG